MNSLSVIQYAIQIDTETELADSSIGLDSGYLRYITGCYDPIASSATYESGANVTGTWSGTYLKKNGIKQSAQRIDITEGGDYAFIGELSLTLANIGKLHRKIMRDSGISIIGKRVQMWVVIDDVFYSRFVGSVSEYVVSDTEFVIQCKDRNNSDSDNLNGYIFGSTYTDFESVTGEIPVHSGLAVAFSRVEDTLKNVDHSYTNNDELSPPRSDVPSYTAEEYTALMNSFFNGFSASAEEAISPVATKYSFHLNGSNLNLSAGMFAKFSTDDNYYLITEVEEYLMDVRQDLYPSAHPLTARTRIDIDSLPDGVDTYSQYLGYQPYNVDYAGSTDLITETQNIDNTGESEDVKKLTVEVYQATQKISMPSGVVPVIENGKLVALDRDGGRVLVDFIDNGDGTYSVQSEKVSDIIQPSKIRHYGMTRAEYILLENGSNAWFDENYFGRVDIASQSLDFSASSYFEPSYAHAFIVESEENISGYNLGLLFRTPNGSRCSWLSQTGAGVGGVDLIRAKFAYYYGAVSTGEIDSRPISQSTNYGNQSDEELIYNASVDKFELGVYDIISTNDYGNTFQISHLSEIPNVQTGGNITPNASLYGYKPIAEDYPVWAAVIDGGSFPLSTFPISALGCQAVTNAQPVEKWLSKLDTVDGLFWDYPDGEYDYKQPQEMGSKRKHLVVIKPVLNQKDTVYGRGVSMIDGTNVSDVTFGISDDTIKFSIDFASLAFVKETEVDPSSLRFALRKIGIQTLSELLSDLSDTTVTLPNRTTWFVGGNITEKTSRFSVVTTLCKQSFVCGYTDRNGIVKFEELEV